MPLSDESFDEILFYIKTKAVEDNNIEALSNPIKGFQIYWDAITDYNTTHSYYVSHKITELQQQKTDIEVNSAADIAAIDAEISQLQGE